MRVAAVLVPVALVVGTVVWLTDRGTETTLVEVVAAADSIHTFILPDGSRIELDPGGVVTYDGAAFGDRRLVTLAGNALFEIASLIDDNGRRAGFTVETDHLTVDVLGTVFRLESGADNAKSAEVSLYSGSVEVTSGDDVGNILVPGQRLVVNIVTGEQTTELIPASEMVTQGVTPQLRFDEATLGDLVLSLEMNHGVKFIMAGGIDPARGKYSANFEDLTLDRVLGMLSQIEPSLAFERDGEVVSITRKQ
jgi:ferric-dicitrate binding protein FerR (iron transport regulator)